MTICIHAGPVTCYNDGRNHKQLALPTLQTKLLSHSVTRCRWQTGDRCPCYILVVEELHVICVFYQKINLMDFFAIEDFYFEIILGSDHWLLF